MANFDDGPDRYKVNRVVIQAPHNNNYKFREDRNVLIYFHKLTNDNFKY